MNRLFFAAGAISAFLGVGAGAMAAHGLKTRLTPEMLAIFEIGARYEMYHAFALIACAWAATQWPGKAAPAAGWLFIAGTVLFSGSLYAMSLTGQRWLGIVTPVGGVAFLAGWLCLAAAALRH